jgi:hypothetical protein
VVSFQALADLPSNRSSIGVPKSGDYRKRTTTAFILLSVIRRVNLADLMATCSDAKGHRQGS